MTGSELDDWIYCLTMLRASPSQCFRCVRFYVLTAVDMQSTVFCDVTPCNFIERDSPTKISEKRTT
jgi:hypothetical protein